MKTSTTSIVDRQQQHRHRSIGVLVGAMAGDMLGAPLEGESSDSIQRTCAALGLSGPYEVIDARRIPDAVMSAKAVGMDLMKEHPDRRGWYTDDTECMLALGESIVQCRGVCARHVALNTSRWWARPPDRGGYSAWTFEKLAKLATGEDYTRTGAMHGTYGNGGAMRIAPIGIAYCQLLLSSSGNDHNDDDEDDDDDDVVVVNDDDDDDDVRKDRKHDGIKQLYEIVQKALMATHTCAEAIEAALVIVLMVAKCCVLPLNIVVDRVEFVQQLAEAVNVPELTTRLRGVASSLCDSKSPSNEQCHDDVDERNVTSETIGAEYFCQYDKHVLQSLCTKEKWFQSRAIDAVTYVVYMFAKYGGLDIDRREHLLSLHSQSRREHHEHHPAPESDRSQSDDHDETTTTRKLSKPEECLVRMIAIGGDTDTLACMLGACLGALYGDSWIPRRWIMAIQSAQSPDIGFEYAVQLGEALSELSCTELVADNNVEALCESLWQELRTYPLPVRHEF